MSDTRRYAPWSAPNSEASSAVRDAMRREQGAVPSPQQLLAMAAKVERALAAGRVGDARKRAGGSLRAGVIAALGTGTITLLVAGLLMRSAPDRVSKGGTSQRVASSSSRLTPRASAESTVAVPATRQGSATGDVGVAIADEVDRLDTSSPTGTVHREADTGAASVRTARGGAVGRTAAHARASIPPAGDELSMLLRARRAANAAPGEALRWLERHARDYPHSAFSEEREALTIEAMIAQGQTRAAATRARVFLASYPGSAYRRRIEALLSR